MSEKKYIKHPDPVYNFNLTTTVITTSTSNAASRKINVVESLSPLCDDKNILLNRKILIFLFHYKLYIYFFSTPLSPTLISIFHTSYKCSSTFYAMRKRRRRSFLIYKIFNFTVSRCFSSEETQLESSAFLCYLLLLCIFMKMEKYCIRAIL